MEAIEKAKVVELAEQIKTQQASLATQADTVARQIIKLQGAASALEYILNLDPVEISDDDEVTELDISQLESYLAANPLEGNEEYEVVVAPDSIQAAEQAIEGAP